MRRALGLLASLVPLLLGGCQTTNERPDPRDVVLETPGDDVDDAPARSASGEAYRAVLEAELHIEKGELPRAIELYREAVVHDADSAGLRVRLGQVMLSVGELEQAREQARAALEREPSHLEAARLFALTHVLLGEKGKAREITERALERHPGDRPLSTMLAELYLENGEVQRAEGVIDRLMRKEPDAIDGYVTLARLFADRGEVGPALVYIDRALGRDERSVEALELKRTVLFAQGRFEDALPVVRRIASERGDSPGMRRDLLVAELLASDDDAARELYEAWLREDAGEMTLLVVTAAFETAGARGRALELLFGETGGALTGRLAIDAGRLAYDARRYDEASRLLCSIPPGQGDPGWFDYARALCVRALERQGRVADAKVSLDEGLLHRPGSWRLLSALLSLSQRDQSGVSKADVLAAVAAARREAPDDVDLLDVAARAHEEHGDVAAARRVLDEALEQRPEQPEVLLLLARFLERNGDPHAAVALAERLMVREAPSVELLNFVAYTLADNGVRTEEARRYAWRAVLKGPLNGYVVDTLGWAEYRAGFPERAVEVLTRADRLSPDEPEILLHLAAAEEAQGAHEQALAHARRGLSLAAPKDRVRQKLEALLQELEGRAS